MSQTITINNSMYLIKGIQLKERVLTPKWFGGLIIWIFFHREDTQTQITIEPVSRRAEPESEDGKK